MPDWTINIPKGAQYTQTITVDGVADIASANNWLISIGIPGSAPILSASITGNGYIAAGTAPNNKILTIPASATTNLTPGNYWFDFDIQWPTKTARYYSLGQCLVLPKVG